MNMQNTMTIDGHQAVITFDPGIQFARRHLSYLFNSNRPEADRQSDLIQMEKISFTLPDGAEISLYRDADGTWCCPVCGSVELSDQPYYAEGGIL